VIGLKENLKNKQDEKLKLVKLEQDIKTKKITWWIP